MAIVNDGRWCQATVSTGALGLRTATAILRREGYRVGTSAMGNQVTDVGVIKLTLIDIQPGTNPDTFPTSDVLRSHIPELREARAV